MASKMKTQPDTEQSSGRGKLLIGVCTVAILAAGASIYFTSRQDSRPGQAAYEKGVAALNSGNVAEATNDFVEGTRVDPDFGPCYVQLGVIYVAQKKFKEAGAAYTRASQLMPDDGKVWFVLSTIDDSLRDLPGAEQAALKAAKLLPTDVQGQLAAVENKIGHADVAYDAYRKAHTLEPGNAAYLITLARFGLVTPHAADQLPYQEQELATYLKANPTDADAAKVMAETQERLPPNPERLESAIKYALVARAGLPKDADVAVDLGQLYLSANRPADALKAYSAADVLKPGSKDIMHGLVVCYVKTGKPDLAAKMSKRIQKLPSAR